MLPPHPLILPLLWSCSSQQGITCVATIHSPTAYAFGLFDSLLMLVRGRMVYSGETGLQLLSYTKSHLMQDLPVHLKGGDAGSIEYLVDLFTEADRAGKAEQLAATFANAREAKALEGQLLKHQDSKKDLTAEEQKELATKKATVTPWWWGIKTIAK